MHYTTLLYFTLHFSYYSSTTSLVSKFWVPDFINLWPYRPTQHNTTQIENINLSFYIGPSSSCSWHFSSFSSLHSFTLTPSLSRLLSLLFSPPPSLSLFLSLLFSLSPSLSLSVAPSLSKHPSHPICIAHSFLSRHIFSLAAQSTECKNKVRETLDPQILWYKDKYWG